MKKLLTVIVSLILIVSLTSCGYSESHQEKIVSTFESFENSQDIILLTNHQLIVKGERYDLSDIKYDDKYCNIVHLDENGFYSFTKSSDNEVSFLFTDYESFEPELLGMDVLPSDLIASFFADGKFGFRIDDNPLTDSRDHAYYFWSVETRQPKIVDYSEDIRNTLEWTKDNRRSKDYTFSSPVLPSLIFGSYLDVTHVGSGETKRIDYKTVLSFNEGKEFQKLIDCTYFSVSRVFEREGDIYFISYYQVGLLGDPCCYWVAKWNFETEECEYYTSLIFDEYQDHIDDMYIPLGEANGQ